MRRRPAAEILSPRARARLRPKAPGGPGAVADEAPVREEFVPGPEELSRSGPPGGRHRRLRPPRPGWVRLPASFVGARWEPGRGAVLGVVLVTVLAVVLLLARVAWARAADEGTVIAPGGGARAGPSDVTAGAAGGGAPAAATSMASITVSGAGEVVVHVVGRVRRPGLQHLPVGSRVADAVAAAGGVATGADLGGINLARVLVDGEQVRVPRPGETVAPGPGAVGGSGTAAVAPVSLNTAGVAELDTLPGVGPVLAQRVVDWRTAHGRFTTVDELAEVSGIGEKLLARLRPLVTT